ncbi:alpha/beta fold hydrolase [Aquimarina sp. U1-2]|uniref:YheT family hydrolase n=1 Tax=Aquimarina sp. U1-2 TaxID=2823141 RepID=UPI001AECF669|nr:alpha/beta fold hydrolase [Aquimarina sp. U1-2]MBP2834123.1 alpha/beta fold hydrolase [Aquimarina sp. U1-2]
MPILPSLYTPIAVFKNSHFSTIYPNLFRKINDVHQHRERLELDDGDFIDLDWSYAKETTQKVAIIIHGLEGNAQRPYMQGLARHLNKHHWDTVCVNLRNCSGTVNRLYQSYNAGASDDIALIVQHVLSKDVYTYVSLCGFSLGGNIILKYLGEGQNIPIHVKSAVVISVPCDLYNSLLEINKPKNYIYQQRFLRNLKAKLYDRQKAFPDRLTASEVKACSSLIDIDNVYTSIAHGYKNAITYYTQCSSKQFLKNIKIPTLILNAKNDTFLGEECYPIEEAKANSNVFLEIPEYGGHVGFYQRGQTYYHEARVLEFFEKISENK